MLSLPHKLALVSVHLVRNNWENWMNHVSDSFDAGKKTNVIFVWNNCSKSNISNFNYFLDTHHVMCNITNGSKLNLVVHSLSLIHHSDG